LSARSRKVSGLLTRRLVLAGCFSAIMGFSPLKIKKPTLFVGQ
jgi:hypothetical protein